MGYRIVYNQPGIVAKSRGQSLRIRMMTVLCFGILVWTVCQVWPEGRVILTEYLLSAEPTYVQEAFMELQDHLHTGSTLIDAFASFCRTVLYEVA